jgi:hypothetical protein
MRGSRLVFPMAGPSASVARKNTGIVRSAIRGQRRPEGCLVGRSLTVAAPSRFRSATQECGLGRSKRQKRRDLFEMNIWDGRVATAAGR